MTIKVYLYNLLFIFINFKDKKNYLSSLQIQITFPMIRILFISLP
jgi:hypothetical protein